jgi:hypothetical protein
MYAPIIAGTEQTAYKMNSIGNKLCDLESTNISKIAIIGKSAIVDKPIFQPDSLFNNFIPNPVKNKRPKLQSEIPSIPVLIIGNKCDS